MHRGRSLLPRDGPGAGTNPTWTRSSRRCPVAGTMVKKLSTVILNVQMSRGCDLCEAAVITTRYFENERLLDRRL